jgi:putative transposase
MAACDICSENWPVVNDGASFLPKYVGHEYKQQVYSARILWPGTFFLEGEVQLVFRLLIFMKQRIGFCFHTRQERVLRWTKSPTISLLLDTLADLARGKSELTAENALLQHRLIILRRQIKRPTY